MAVMKNCRPATPSSFSCCACWTSCRLLDFEPRHGVHHRVVGISRLREGQRQTSASRSQLVYGSRRAGVIVLATSREDLMRRAREKARQAEKGWEPSRAKHVRSKVEHHVQNQEKDWGARVSCSDRAHLERTYNTGPSTLWRYLAFAKCVVLGASECDVYLE